MADERQKPTDSRCSATPTSTNTKKTTPRFIRVKLLRIKAKSS